MSETLLADITTCMIPVPLPGSPGHFKPCGQRFTSPGVTILGAKQSRLNLYMEGLGKHVGEKHPEVGLQMAQIGAAFMEMLFLRNFKTTDAELTEMQDRVRWQVHQQTLKARYPDENLVVQASDLAVVIFNTFQEGGHHSDDLKAAIADRITDAFVSIRDALEEPGKYSTPVPEAAKVMID